jgi:hypothetical protein
MYYYTTRGLAFGVKYQKEDSAKNGGPHRD